MPTTSTANNGQSLSLRNATLPTLLFVLLATTGAAAQGSGVIQPGSPEANTKCDLIRRVLMGEDGTGKTDGLRYDRLQAEAEVAKLKTLFQKTQQNPLPTGIMDQNVYEDLRLLKGPWAVAPPDREDIVLARRDLDYWTAQKEKRELDTTIISSRDEYPTSLQQDLAQEEQRLTEINRSIAMENDIADNLKCQTYWNSHPFTRQSATNLAPGVTGQPNPSPSGPNERIKIIGASQCQEDPTDIGVLGGATCSALLLGGMM